MPTQTTQTTQINLPAIRERTFRGEAMAKNTTTVQAQLDRIALLIEVDKLTALVESLRAALRHMIATYEEEAGETIALQQARLLVNEPAKEPAKEGAE